MSKVILAIVLILIVAASSVYLFKSQPNQTPASSPKPILTPTTKLALYHVKDMQFSILVPSSYQVTERFLSITIISPEGAKIYIDRNGTDFENIDSYLGFLEDKNHFSLDVQQHITINGLPTVFGIDKGQKIYFIYANSWVYNISDSSTTLDPVLDQIARSFKYVP